MLHRDATLNQVRMHLLREVRSIYPDNESGSMTRMILEHVGLTPARCIAEPLRKAGPEKVSQINEIVDELYTRKPIQYILGYTWFCDLKIVLNDKTLIPRPETEEMVSRIVQSDTRSPVHIIDLGTGSGCIALAMKKSYPQAEIVGVDADPGTLEVAARNSIINHLEVKWIRHDLLSEAPLTVENGINQVPGNPSFSRDGFDLVISNPPYVTMEERKGMESHILDYEPHGALFVEDDDPLVYYRAIARFCRNHLVAGGSLWVEINEHYGKDTSRLLKGEGFSRITIHKDLYGKERFISATGRHARFP